MKERNLRRENFETQQILRQQFLDGYNNQLGEQKHAILTEQTFLRPENPETILTEEKF